MSHLVLKGLGYSCVLILGFLIFSFGYFSPLFKTFPKTTGTYAVGIKSCYLVDKIQNNGSSLNGVMVQFLYPADQQKGANHFYLGEKFSFLKTMGSQKFHIPKFLMV